MSGRGKAGGKGLGKGGAKRHRRIFRYPFQRIRKAHIRHRVRRGGVKLYNALVYEDVLGVMKSFLEKVIPDSVAFCEQANRTTVTDEDIFNAFNLQGKPHYGFGK